MEYLITIESENELSVKSNTYNSTDAILKVVELEQKKAKYTVHESTCIIDRRL